MFGLFKWPDSSRTPANDYPDSNLKYKIGRPGEIAVVDEMIQGPYKPGRVHFRDSYWPASCHQEIVLGPGDLVRVVGIEGITLLVQPLGVFEPPHRQTL
ncbi:NfeD family protein [Phormidium sp. CCY1219]|uniref:NfeD family protein n=1 Tax=Phormidium sp. CCY1219 TaxID=2886104 RepID=UPI002D1ED88E|nr:NfeD family protein [Phormidium sp. CCY1219]MEB3828670.1 NfeD family protein [Phormidium sp. CCY1219]